MKILAINNYDLEWAFKQSGQVPLHQSWGISFFRSKGDDVDTITFSFEAFPLKKILGVRYASKVYNIYIY